MSRVLLAAGVLVVLVPAGRAGETVIHLTVRPMPAPQPALKYLLLPEVREMNAGNPVQWYIRCFAEQQNFFYHKESVAARARYRSMPLAALPLGELRNYGGSALRQADWAARLDTPDWQVLPRLRTEGTDLQSPELPPLRILAEALQVRFRGEVADRRFADAVRTAKTMFALARHLGEHPTQGGNRTGLYAARLVLETLDEMIQQPGCPNLYWALTDLPCPLVDLRKGAQGDCARVAADLAAIRDDDAMTAEEAEKVVSRLSGAIGLAREQAGRPPRSLRAGLAARLKDADGVRARLVETGKAEDLARSFLRVQTFPAMQVILLDEKHRYETRRDEDMKLLSLAPWQIDALTAGRKGEHGTSSLLADLLPRVLESRRSQGRLQQRIALLRCVEALRLFAAAHGGKLPDRLSECTVPLPDDPFTGKPFAYKVEGATAHLRGAPPRGEETNPEFNVRYEITLRK